MIKLLRLGLCILLLVFISLIAPTGASALRTIDNLDEGLFDTFIGGAGSGAATVMTGLNNSNVVGGERIVDVTFENGTGNVTGVISNGTFAYSSSINANGVLTLAYFQGGNLNLDISNEDRFHLRFASFNFAGGRSMLVRVSVSDPFFISDADMFLTLAGPQDLFFPFSNFAPIDFSSIRVLQIFLQPEAGQTFSLDFFQAETNTRVEEPYSLTLMIVGLILLFAQQGSRSFFADPNMQVDDRSRLQSPLGSPLRNKGAIPNSSFRMSWRNIWKRKRASWRR